MWEIPLIRVAGALAVTFTGSDTDQASPPTTSEAPAVQRPGSPPVLPPPDSDVSPPVEPEPEPEPGPTPVPEPASSEPAPVAEPPTPPTEPAPEPPSTEPRRDPIDARESSVLDEDVAPVASRSGDEARSTGLLRPTDKRRFFSIGVGGSTGGGPYASYFGGMDFQWEMAIGAHSRRRPNFGGAFVLQQRKGFINELSFVGRMQWDKQLTDRFALYSSVNLDLGVNVPIGYGPYLGAFGIPSAMIGVGWSFKAILAERLLTFIRPVNPNLIAPQFYAFPLFVAIRWDVIAGFGIVW